MDPKTFEEASRLAAREIADLVVSKQHDYGKRNILDFEEYGVLVRANDKVARLKNLIPKKLKPNHESIYKNWQDMGGYAIIALMLRKGWFKLPLGKGGKT